MRHVALALAGVAIGVSLGAQSPEKELVAAIASNVIDNGIVSEVAWDGSLLVIQTAAMQRDGQLSPRYFTAPGPGMSLKHLSSAPPGLEDYWRKKSSRISPTGLGRITSFTDSKMPMVGIGALERRLLEANQMGGVDVVFELRLGHLLLHSRKLVEPYDGEVWAWSPARLNRIAYVDGRGDLWIARADGSDAERIARGDFTLPAWSEDGRLLAIAERKNGGKRWEISVLHLAERYRDVDGRRE